MKTTKIVMLVALFAFVGMTYAGVDPGPTPISVKIYLKSAMQDRGLVQAIYEQVDPRTLLQGDQIFYSAKVMYRNAVYVIVGKLYEWENFFLLEPKDEPKEKGPKKDFRDQPLFKSAK